MHARRGPTAQRGVVVGGVHVELVQVVTALVQHGEDVGRDVVRVHVRRGDGIVDAQRVGEGMLRRGEPVGVQVDAFQDGDVAGEHPLATLVEAALDAGAAGLALGADVHEQRHDAVLDHGEEAVVELAAAALLVLVQPDVIGVGARVLLVREAPHGGDDAVQVGLEGVPVVVELCAAPDGVGLVGEAREGGLVLAGDVDQAVAVALQDADLRQGRGVQTVGATREALQRGPDAAGAQQVVVLLLQDRHGLRAVCGDVGRVDGEAVAGHARLGIAVRVEVTLKVCDGGDVRLDGCLRDCRGCRRDGGVCRGWRSWCGRHRRVGWGGNLVGNGRVGRVGLARRALWRGLPAVARALCRLARLVCVGCVVCHVLSYSAARGRARVVREVEFTLPCPCVANSGQSSAPCGQAVKGARRWRCRQPWNAARPRMLMRGHLRRRLVASPHVT